MKHLPRCIFLLYLLFNTLCGFGQNYQVNGTILDSKTRQPVNAASVILKNSGRGTTANDKGEFSLTLTDFPSVLFIQCMGYLRDTVVIETESQYLSEYKNQKRNFLLAPSPVEITEVQIKARSTLFEKDPYAIIDFKIAGKHIVALGYKNGNEFRKEILLADLSGKMISNYSFAQLDSLYQDCQGNIFVFCSDSAFELKVTRKQVTILNSYQRSFISDFIVPVCGVSDSLIFLKKSSVHLQYDNYFAVKDSQYAIVVYTTGGMKKEAQVANLRNYWKTQARLPVTIKDPPKAGKDWVKFMESYDRLYQDFFTSHQRLHTDYQAVFSKMIPYDKNQLIFDREAATIFQLDENGGITSEVGMITELNGIHYQDVLLDMGTGKIYLEYPQGPYTCFLEINPVTGQEIRRFVVRDFRHIEKCRFLNGRLYFLHQPDTGLRIKKVYSIWI